MPRPGFPLPMTEDQALKDAPRAFEMFLNKTGHCEKVVLKALGAFARKKCVQQWREHRSGSAHPNVLVGMQGEEADELG